MIFEEKDKDEDEEDDDDGMHVLNLLKGMEEKVGGEG